MISSLTLDPDTPEDEWGNPTVRHGTNCRKAPHDQPGMLHEESDDRPYEVDGLMYCGRCHVWLPQVN